MNNCENIDVTVLKVPSPNQLLSDSCSTFELNLPVKIDILLSALPLS